MTRKVCVVGLGNEILQDDSVGLHVVRRLKEGYEFQPGIDLKDGGTAGLDLLPEIEGYEKIVFVDAADTGESPGTVVIVEGDAIPSFLTARSVHHIGLSDLLFAARMADVLPAEICLVGIQPESVGLGLELTDTLKQHFDLLVATVLQRLRRWGIESIQSGCPMRP